GLAEVEDLHDVRVLHAGRDLGLVDEHLDEAEIGREVRMDALDDDDLLEAEGTGEPRTEHLGHPADPASLEQLVLATAPRQGPRRVPAGHDAWDITATLEP